ncbi:MAG TPA: 3-deoxy-manno-octulosonate cytidylyltransferase [Planctomycetaceae bacterium]|mgnify:CR=1 FL=1|nr:3-deoxy-manno-octulosonate cytidylyltransferase [Planctomycetaceae bacterium]
MKVTGIIPARLHSSRLPEKLLLAQTGRPLLQYVWETASQCADLDDVIVAADSEQIADAVRTFGGRVELTGDHPSGTDRIAEVAERCCPDSDVIVNLQGDEPELESSTITELVNSIRNSGSEMATVAAPFTNDSDVQSPDCVKVVLNDASEALYFSRSVIPYPRDSSVQDVLSRLESPYLLHVGLYAFQRDFLMRLTGTPPSSLERLEKLEQLRALQMGAKISVAVVREAAVGIDTAEDYAAFVTRTKNRAQN